MRKTTLGELRNFLPIGMPKPAGDGFVNDFSFKPYRMPEERYIAKLMGPSKTAGKFISEIMAHMLVSCCGRDFKGLSEPERRVFVEQLFFSDVQYLYLYLRREALGPKIRLPVTCPRCRIDFAWIGDLDSLTVRCLEGQSELTTTYEMHSPIEIHGQPRPIVRLSAMRWFALTKRMGDDYAQEEIIKSSISGYEGYNPEQPFVLPPDATEQLVKLDIEQMTQVIGDLNAGPEIALQGKCEGCNSDFLVPIRWQDFESFFGASSLTPLKRS